MTRNGKLILDMINRANEHLSAEQIYLRLKQVSPKTVLATVYNNLNRLNAEGLIHKVSVEGYPDQYDRAIKHDHLICKRCGKISDVTLQDLTASLAAQLDIQILYYDLKVGYICPECQNHAAQGGK